MKLKFTLRSAGEVDTDLVATVDATTTIGQLAEYLVVADPSRGGAPAQDATGQFTLALVDEDYRALDHRATLAESGLRSGVHVAVSRARDGYADGARAVATAVVTAGPDQGREVPLAPGTAYIGRGRGCEVRVADPSVSRRHAKLLVTDVAEVVDLGSSNGVVIGGDQVDRAVLRTGDRFRLGETEIELRMLAGATGVVAARGVSMPFSRSPRIAPLYRGRQWPIPELPERPKPERIPWLSAFAPALFGVVLAVALQNLFFLLFVLLSPIMIFAHFVESRRHARQDYAEAMTHFREDLDAMVGALREEQEREVAGRQAEHPAAAEAVEAVVERSPLLWTRRRADPGFLELRLGLGTLPSRNPMELPQLGRARAEAWLETSQAVEGLGAVSDVPVAGLPLHTGALGVAGPRARSLEAARALLAQVVGLHSPADVVVAAFASPATARDWDWLKWVPHTASPHSPLGPRHLASSGPACAGLLTELEELVAADGDDGAAPAPAPVEDPQGFTPPALPADRPAVVVLVEDDAPVERSRLVQLAENGWRHGVVVVWVAPTTPLLPAACRTFVETSADGSTDTVGFVGEAVVRTPVTTDTVAAADVERAARLMAPVVDSGVPVDDDSDLPRSVSFLSLVGPELAEAPGAVIERWGESRSILTGPYAAPADARAKAGNLRAVVGQSTQGTFSIDLRADGPHALVGGTTGAGKSELLQAWILGMAAAHSPQRLTFLLVDYKGGSAFRDCVNLPHTVGLVTDLSPHLVRRALASLSAELRHREHILAQHKAKDLVELERRGEVAAPPSLVIVVDEFAALVQEVPEFVDGVVNVAQRGRSLGLHLILATQRPAGVIKDNLRANTNLRLALRMADEADSEDVLGTTAAAYFDPALPGRAVSKSGPGRLTPFQTGYAGGWTSDEPPRAEVTVETLGFGSGVPWERPVAEEHGAAAADLGPTDIQRIVTQIGTASQEAQIPAPRKPWLPELAPVYDLAALPTARRDDEFVFGVSDEPESQSQPVIAFRPDVEGNLAVYGASGSGKSAFLRSIAVAAGFTVRGGPCHVYGLDFGNRGLAMLEGLPHVGSVIYGGDHERLVRLLTMLRETIDERAVRYSQMSAATITEYRQLSGAQDEPRILVLVDGLAAFAQAYDNGPGQKWVDELTSIAADGRPVGVHLVVTVDQRSGMWGTLSSAVQQRVVLRMASVDDYLSLDVPSDVLSLASPPGRAIVHGREVQVAVLGGSAESTAQARAIKAFGEAVRRAGGSEAAPIRSLPERVELAELPALDAEGRAVVGLSSTTLRPVGYVLRGPHMVLGPSGSGRTTTVLTMVQAARRARPGLQAWLFSPRKSALTRAEGLWAGVAVGADACESAAERLRAQVVDAGDDGASMLVVVERAQDLDNSGCEDAIADLVREMLGAEQVVIAEADSSFFNSSYGLAGGFRGGRSGISLQPNGDDSQAFSVDYRGVSGDQVLEGRGYLVTRGTPELVQIALPIPLGRNGIAGDLDGTRVPQHTG
ncbi:FtsK/SpoIIIE domain-containing protein [Knoellia sp. 3-2P3]|uniref:FtsK/SpoIIIE domain-containing protein n=1 Tax=unclassified Knoellia TaxID=2618719 RepID=UPI0023DB14BA|nr:FtsK/SpoIIIE domain-containing protein [Knoellia sp. 3-2P3]MDF2091327.1 FtsK/SpoIIIE domain-containing protein [Knoellia sp. 3-2P3]